MNKLLVFFSSKSTRFSFIFNDSMNYVKLSVALAGIGAYYEGPDVIDRFYRQILMNVFFPFHSSVFLPFSSFQHPVRRYCWIYSHFIDIFGSRSSQDVKWAFRTLRSAGWGTWLNIFVHFFFFFCPYTIYSTMLT